MLLKPLKQFLKLIKKQVVAVAGVEVRGVDLESVPY